MKQLDKNTLFLSGIIVLSAVFYYFTLPFMRLLHQIFGCG